MLSKAIGGVLHFVGISDSLTPDTNEYTNSFDRLLLPVRGSPRTINTWNLRVFVLWLDVHGSPWTS